MEMSSISTRVLGGLLEERTGQQLIGSRYPRVGAVLRPLMRQREIATLDQLAGLVAMGRDSALVNEVVEALLNHETSFFREPAAFAQLTGEALPALAAKRNGTKRLRIWSAGCSTGQEAYSLAISFAEQQELWADWMIEIVASDISAAAIEQARRGVYSQFEIQRGLSIRRALQWFDVVDEQWHARPELRSRVNFQIHSLMEPVPFGGRFDAILCRNVLLYFSLDRRRTVFERLAAAIAPVGLLMLGAAETVLGQTDDFEAHGEYRGLYRPIVGASQRQ